MIRQPPRSTRTDTLFPYTTLFRSLVLFDPWIKNLGRIDEFPFPCEKNILVRVTAGPSRIGCREMLRPECRRSEEHTSELQSLMRISYAVFCLKKKQK